ncbi:hypothetical protein AMAG_01007 [Allomyces macrogynus ATCC 38327]|uniref:SEC7 domain-containing protein n=1 Tax=Allomyces macrogynus (strain ATCC 38327) TaxID=578462 RepID=A0A0L0RYE7_ALLM3|nr:hypothetical protein AMAG_01007 [Allomyces macrogynus ATCC 38327]|eukprot:KNE55071.1 hypothetical protein AMAG_01007 [Allomyces macrogynus ATCC 38327]
MYAAQPPPPPRAVLPPARSALPPQQGPPYMANNNSNAPNNYAAAPNGNYAAPSSNYAAPNGTYGLPAPMPAPMPNPRGVQAAAPCQDPSPAPDGDMRNVQRQKSINALRKATLERQTKSSMERTAVGSPAPGPGPQAQYANNGHNDMNGYQNPNAAGGGGYDAGPQPWGMLPPTATPPQDVVQYMESLTRAYKSGASRGDVDNILQSEETKRVSRFLMASSSGTLTRGGGATGMPAQTMRSFDAFNPPSEPTLPIAPAPVFRMDTYCETIYGWICTVTGEPMAEYPSLAAALRSGDSLAQLARKMVPKPPPTDFLTADASYSIHKIIYFLDCCRHIGIPEDRTFPLTDLMMDDGDPRAIILTLQALESAARKKGWNGPYLPSPPQGYFVGEYAAPRVVPRTVEVVRPEIQRFTYAQPVASVAGSIYSAVAPSNGISPAPSPAPPSGAPGGPPPARERSNTFPAAPARSMSANSTTSNGTPQHFPSIQNGALRPSQSMRVAAVTAAASGGSNANSAMPPPRQRSASASSSVHSSSAQGAVAVRDFVNAEDALVRDISVARDWRAWARAQAGNVDALAEVHAHVAAALRGCATPDAAAAAVLAHGAALRKEHEAFQVAHAARLALVAARAGTVPVREFTSWARGVGALDTVLTRVCTSLATVFVPNLAAMLALNVEPVGRLRQALQAVKEMIQAIDSAVAARGAASAASNKDPPLPAPSTPTVVPTSHYMVPTVVDGTDTDLGFGSATLRRNLHHTVDIAALESQSRQFICQGSLWEVVSAGEVKVRSLLLFHDVLVIAKEVPPNRFDVRNVLDLRTLIVRPTRDKQRQALRLRPVVAHAVTKFNANPTAAIAYLTQKRVLDGNPSNIASFLHKTPNLSRRQVGKYIGAPENDAVVQAYAEWLAPAFPRLPLEDALRLYLSTLRLSNDGPAIDRVLTAFAHQYFRTNPPPHGGIESAAAAVALVFATILLNADLHGASATSSGAPHAPPAVAASLRDFLAAHPRVAPDVARAVYQSVQAEKLAMAPADDRPAGTNGTATNASASTSPSPSSRGTVDVSAFPTFLTVGEPSEWIRVSVAHADPGLTLRVLAGPDVAIEPASISFAAGPVQYVRLTPSALGRRRVFFMPGGANAPKYEYILPVTITVEPPYMKHTFAVEVPAAAVAAARSASSGGMGGASASASAAAAAAASGKRTVLTFSVATDEQRARWVSYISNAIDQLKHRAGGAPGQQQAG